MKYDKRFKLRIVKECLSGSKGVKAIARIHELGPSMLRRWVVSYQAHGPSGLAHSPRRYSPAFKLSVLRRMWRDGLSYGRTAVLFDIRNADHLSRWERQYHSGGKGALASRPRGRPPAMPDSKPPKPSTPSAPDEQRSREELLNELEFLRAENAYLKKLDALIQAKKLAVRKPRS
jgi:transposase